MEPLDKNNQIIQDVKNPAKQSQVVENTGNPPKHNNLLIVLLLVLFFAAASFGALMVYQAKQGNKTVPESDQGIKTKTVAPLDEIAGTPSDSTDKLDQPVTSDIDTELNNLDSSMNSQKDTNFSDITISDTSLGL